MTVDGPIMGYVRTTQRSKFVDPAYHRYHAFKQRVRLLGNRERVPHDLCSDDQIKVRISVSWKIRQRIDLDNVVKGILDAFWKQDRRVLSIEAIAEEHTGTERVDIWIERLPGPGDIPDDF